MTKLEIAELITVMHINFPDTARGQSEEAFKTKVALWYGFFKDYPKELVYAAAKAFIANDTKGFMPNIGQINDCTQKIRCQDNMIEGEAWSLVLRAMRVHSWDARAEFDKLPQVIQRLVGAPSQLQEWAQMDSDTVNSVVASNFQRSYRARAKNERDYLALPSSVKSYMATFADGMKMPELPTAAEEDQRRIEQIRRVAAL